MKVYSIVVMEVHIGENRRCINDVDLQNILNLILISFNGDVQRKLLDVQYKNKVNFYVQMCKTL